MNCDATERPQPARSQPTIEPWRNWYALDAEAGATRLIARSRSSRSYCASTAWVWERARRLCSVPAGRERPRRRRDLPGIVLPILLFVFGACLAPGLSAQVPQTWDAGRLQLTRAELESLLEKFDAAGRTASYSNEFRLRATEEANLVRERLRDGDFQVGDQVSLAIEGEQGMPLTLTVGPGRVLTIPNFGELSLAGVLRSELQEKAHAHIAKYVQSPVVQTRPLIRVAVIGQVGRPGFYVLPAESLISEAIMAAGGPAPNAAMNKARIERGAQRIWEGKILHQAISDGRTLDQMSLRSGDQLVLPATGGGASGLLRNAMILPGLLVAITGLIALF
jgi:protein involved in polysaccharide export with SLBB domain